MASKNTIVQQIENTIQGEFSSWSVGVTSDPAVRKAQLGNPLSWLQWQADSDKVAKQALDEIVGKGARRSGPVSQSGTFVYIFRSV